jgi:glutamyl-tRNA synthetase
MTKLKWMNGEYFKAMDDDKFYEMALPYMKEVISRDMDFKKIASMVKTRIEILPDIKEQIDFLEEVPEYSIDMYTHKKMKTNAENSLTLLTEVLPILEAQEAYDNDSLFEALSAFAKEKEYKTGFVMWPIRTAVSGKQATPGGATELMALLGKDETIKRINAAITKLSKN